MWPRHKRALLGFTAGMSHMFAVIATDIGLGGIFLFVGTFLLLNAWET